MSAPLARLTTRRIMVLCLLVALALGGWAEWTGRRARAILGATRHGHFESILSARVESYSRQVRRVKREAAWPQAVAQMAAWLGLPVAALEAESGRVLSAEERRLLAEHDRAARAMARSDHYRVAIPPAGRNRLAIKELTHMIEPGWLLRTLQAEATERRLRQRCEYAIDRPWIAVPPEPPPAWDF